MIIRFEMRIGFEIMKDVMFAKAHMGEYFQWQGRKVRVIGYDTTGSRNSVIVDCEDGWHVSSAYHTAVINRELCETGNCHYAGWEELK